MSLVVAFFVWKQQNVSHRDGAAQQQPASPDTSRPFKQCGGVGGGLNGRRGGEGSYSREYNAINYFLSSVMESLLTSLIIRQHNTTIR